MTKRVEREPYEPYGKVRQMDWNYEQTGEEMYSFDRPVWAFWRGFAASLRSRGLTDAEITTELCSTGTSHFLDGEAEKIESLGEQLGSIYPLYVTKRRKEARP